MNDDGVLTGIVEKPDPATRRELGARALVSMTCWRFEPTIFEACRAIAPSVRGEYEIPDAVSHATERLGVSFQVAAVREPVLDLSRREDIAAVAEHLRGWEVAL
jgi:glucose-1-phosphate thymidylyltransferase